MDVKELDFSKFPYRMARKEKDPWFTARLRELTEYHYRRCLPYRRMLDALGYGEGTADACRKLPQFSAEHYRKLPWIPVGLFKELALSSLSEDTDYKVGQSSGTTGQAASRVILDGETRTLQQQALAAIGRTLLGEGRLPMLVVERASILKEGSAFSAKAAGIRGFSLFGRHRTFAIREDGSLDREGIEEFLGRWGSGPFLIYGFTSQVWRHLYLVPREMGWQPKLSRGILIHGGGWKKMQDQAVSRKAFREGLKEQCGLWRIYEYYGMAEQTGSIFMACEEGHLHCSDYSAVLFRRTEDFSLCDSGEKGLIQVMSLLPRSYPGHNLLTADEGILLGVDDCPCGRKGAYFTVVGRVAGAQVRGCSDTYEVAETEHE